MADIVNRSPFVVEVETPSKRQAHAGLTKQFPYKQKTEAVSYAATLLQQGLTARITQLETSFQVRIRGKGAAAKVLTFPTYAEADQHVTRVESDRKVGLHRDYMQGAKTTTAGLIQRYILEECPSLKGGDNYITMLKAMLEDSENKLLQRIEQRKREMREHGKTLTPLGANRAPMTSLEWLHLPLTKVRPEHFHDYIRDRLEYVNADTIDRYLDLLSRIYNMAQTTWRIHLDVHPMLGVKRPSYFNERDRRLVDDEEMRLLEAARKEDQLLLLANLPDSAPLVDSRWVGHRLLAGYASLRWSRNSQRYLATPKSLVSTLRAARQREHRAIPLNRHLAGRPFETVAPSHGCLPMRAPESTWCGSAGERHYPRCPLSPDGHRRCRHPGRTSCTAEPSYPGDCRRQTAPDFLGEPHSPELDVVDRADLTQTLCPASLSADSPLRRRLATRFAGTSIARSHPAAVSVRRYARSRRV